MNPFYTGDDQFEMNENEDQSKKDKSKKMQKDFDEKNEFLPYWVEQIPQIKYQPLHWLAFWNDHQSIDYLLTTLRSEECGISFKDLLLPDQNGFTALDFAGMHSSFESMFIFIEFFKQHFGEFEKIFNTDKKNLPKPDSSDSEGNTDWYSHADMEHPWIITRVKHSELNATQSIFARSFYWAAFIGD